MKELKQHFISSSSEYREGAVHVFWQKFAAQNVKSAVLFMTALGIYDVSVNGIDVQEQYFAPGYTYYPRDLFYQKMDVTDAIHNGENILKVYLAQGWYCGRFTFDNKTQIYGDQPAVSWVLQIETMDGRKSEIVSSPDVTELASPYAYAGFYDGEIYDATVMEQEIGKAVPYTGAVPDHLEETFTKVRLQEEMPVRAVMQREDSTILDFGQNFAGVITIDPGELPEGTTLTIRHGEILNADGSLYTANLRKAKAEIVYTSGHEKKIYIPKFTYMGFRYAELKGAPYHEGMISARALYSEMKRTGYFQCSNAMVQQLYENQVWGQKSNYVEIPTDCPQRDERMGYTGDGHVYALTGSYNFDTRDFFRKFLKDIRYSQTDNSEGYIPSTVPAQGPAEIGFLNMLGWGNAVTIIPEMLEQQFGSRTALEEQYESIRAFTEMEIRKMGKDQLWIGVNLGDWLMPGKNMGWMAVHNNPVSNSFIVHDLEVISRLAEALGKKEDAERYRHQLELTRTAYQNKFIRKNGKIRGDYQGAYVMALTYVVTEETLRRKMLGYLIRDIRKNGLNTGFFATEHLLPLLADHGESRLAYDLLLQENCPGWMYEIKKGATTVWERWDAIRPDGSVNEAKSGGDNMVSFNHYAFGSVGEFYYRYILGIRPLEPGYRKALIRPYPDVRLGSVSGSYASVNGRIAVAWKYTGKEEVSISAELEMPGRIELPDGRTMDVTAGKYEYVVKTG